MNNESKENIKKNKKQKKNKIGAKSIVLVVFLAVLVIGVFVAVSGEIPFSELFSSVTQSSSAGASKSSGFPIILSVPLRKVDVSKNSIYAVTKNSAICFDSSGKKKQEIILNYSDPMIKTSGKYALVYDRQGNGFTLLSGEKTLLSSKTDDSTLIYTASVCDNGNFILVSKSNKAASSLSLYSKKGEILYKWNCANEYIVSADSYNSKFIACAAVGSVSGQIMTRMYFFDLGNSNNNRDFTFNDTSALDCSFIKSKTVSIMCNNRRIVVDCGSDGLSPIQAQFTGSLYKRADDGTGNTAVLLRKNDSYNEFELKVFADDNNIIFEKEISSSVKDIACDKSKVYIMTDGNIIRVGDNEKELVNFSSAFDYILAKSGKIYYYSTNMICKN